MGVYLRGTPTPIMALVTLATFLLMPIFLANHVLADECHLTPVIHVLQHPGCIPKPIPSFACTGRCTSYVQVSGSKIWQTERSCMCCQDSGEREANVALYCPKAAYDEPKVRKLVTRAPAECMCRPCTAVEEGSIMVSELSGYVDAGQLVKSLGQLPSNRNRVARRSSQF